MSFAKLQGSYLVYLIFQKRARATHIIVASSPMYEFTACGCSCSIEIFVCRETLLRTALFQKPMIFIDASNRFDPIYKCCAQILLIVGTRKPLQRFCQNNLAHKLGNFQILPFFRFPHYNHI